MPVRFVVGHQGQRPQVRCKVRHDQSVARRGAREGATDRSHCGGLTGSTGTDSIPIPNPDLVGALLGGLRCAALLPTACYGDVQTSGLGRRVLSASRLIRRLTASLAAHHLAASSPPNWSSTCSPVKVVWLPGPVLLTLILSLRPCANLSAHVPTSRRSHTTTTSSLSPPPSGSLPALAPKSKRLLISSWVPLF
jgi:hypothetical protein